MVSVPMPSHEPARRLVLVADDEPTIQMIIARVLVQLGFTPLLVGDGLAAIDIVQQRGGELACAILDISMPGANGIDAAHVIQQLAPALPITLVSAALPNVAAGEISRLRLAGVLDKPFSLAALRSLILHAVAQGTPPEAPLLSNAVGQL